MNTKKSFAYGYAQIVNWFISWAIFGFVCAQGANVYRQGICDLYGLSMSPILYAVSIAGWVGVVMFVVAPFIIKKIGARNLLIITACLGGLSFILCPMVNNVVWIGFFSGLNDVLASLYCASTTMVLVSKWFPRKKAPVMGIITSGGLLASLVFLPVFNKIIAVGGIKTAMVAAGVFLLAYGFLSIFWLKETPEQAGLLPDNMPYDQGKVADLGSKDELWGWKKILTRWQFWVISIGWGMILMVLLGYLSTTVSFMVGRGVDINLAVTAMAITGVVQFVISILSGFIDQKIGAAKTTVIVISILLFIGFGITGFYHGASPAPYILACLLIVGSFGAGNNLYASQILTLMGPKNYNISYNGLCTITSIIKTFGTFICAAGLARSGDYASSYKVFLVIAIVGTILILFGGNKKIVPEAKAE